MKKFLVVSLSNLGDAILTYPALHALWSAYPEAHCHVLASPRTRELFEGEQRVHRVWVWEKRTSLLKQLALLRALFLERFELVADFRNSLIPLICLGAKRTKIFNRSSRGSDSVPHPTHRAERHLELVTDLGVASPATPVSLPYGPEEERAVEGWLEEGRQPVVMIPGARSHLKRWKASGFAEIADRLIQKHNAQILLVGDDSERPIAQAVQGAMQERAMDLAGCTSIRHLAALFTRAALVITNDCACLHAADAMHAPTLALFGPTDELKYGPRGKRTQVIRRRLTCAPCELALCPYEHQCMQWIEPQEVYAAAAELLELDRKPIPLQHVRE